jgi:integrase
LRWRDVDLKRGRVNLEKDKTSDPRDWDLRPDTVEALRRWKAAYHPDSELADHVFAENGAALNIEHLADQVRNDLRRVGVTRPQLFESSETRQRFRAHDLRATFVTIALATGKTETWVSDRTGHDGHTMIDKYRRKARTWNLGELGRLYELIPELCTAEPSARITTRISHDITARVAKLADAADLGSAAARRMGSTPFPCTFV